LTTTYGFGPSGYLYVDNEILYFDTVQGKYVNIPNINGRGQLNTAPAAHSFATKAVGQGDNQLEPGVDQIVSLGDPHVFVSSTVFITITGPKGGQEILAPGQFNGKTYFITFDINDFATLGQTNIGLSMPTSGYMTAPDPKQIGANKFPMYSDISEIDEYKDEVQVTPEDTTILPTLKQGATNQAVYDFLLETKKSDAYFQDVRITRSGSSSDSDIIKVRIWYDGNNDGLLNLGTTQDWIVGEGYFNNPGGDLGKAYITIATSTIVLDGGYPVDPQLWQDITVNRHDQSDKVHRAKRFFVTYETRLHPKRLSA
jgi:hypothetical protein